MADSEEAVGGAGSGDDTSADYPTVEPAEQPDNPRYGTEHEEPSGEPQPIPGGES